MHTEESIHTSVTIAIKASIVVTTIKNIQHLTQEKSISIARNVDNLSKLITLYETTVVQALQVIVEHIGIPYKLTRRQEIIFSLRSGADTGFSKGGSVVRKSEVTRPSELKICLKFKKNVGKRGGCTPPTHPLNPPQQILSIRKDYFDSTKFCTYPCQQYIILSFTLHQNIIILCVT